MRAFHNVIMTVFCKQGEDPALTEAKLCSFFPFEKERVKLGQQKATGFNDKAITVYDITLEKEAHITQFLRWLLDTLNMDQKAMILRQLESRLDDELTFFIRFDKKAWNEEGRLFIIDHGDCYHLKMRVAAYPKTRNAALKVLHELFKA